MLVDVVAHEQGRRVMLATRLTEPALEVEDLVLLVYRDS